LVTSVRFDSQFQTKTNEFPSVPGFAEKKTFFWHRSFFPNSQHGCGLLFWSQLWRRCYNLRKTHTYIFIRYMVMTGLMRGKSLRWVCKMKFFVFFWSLSREGDGWELLQWAVTCPGSPVGLSSAWLKYVVVGEACLLDASCSHGIWDPARNALHARCPEGQKIAFRLFLVFH